MSQISNRFFVTALDDGTTLHGNLSVDGSLSQAWNGSAAVPNWSTNTTTWVGTDAQPTIMLTLLSGATYIGTNSTSPNGYISEAKWYYNDNGTDSEILFSNTETTITVGSSTVTGFLDTNMSQKFLKLKTGRSLNGVTVPALRIIQNLASSTNVDLDTITLKGKYNSGSGILDFQASMQARVSVMSSGAFLGVIKFLNGKSDIVEKTDTITMTGILYSADGNVVSSLKTEWFLNDVTFSAKSTTNTVTVTESDITDNAVVRCDFYEIVDGSDELRATAYASIDDMQDPEFMYIQYNGANGNAASLRKGQTATFDIWIGTTTNPTVDTTYAYFQTKLLDGTGSTITADLSSYSIAAADANGWRNLVVNGTTHKASIAIPYDLVNTYNKNMTGLIRASTAQFT